MAMGVSIVVPVVHRRWRRDLPSQKALFRRFKMLRPDLQRLLSAGDGNAGKMIKLVHAGQPRRELNHSAMGAGMGKGQHRLCVVPNAQREIKAPMREHIRLQTQRITARLPLHLTRLPEKFQPV
ncbi:MAG: hypothetical protein R3186_06315, partial [Ruegeria sp.]|nr:hypothetical protein [Ruegeria sp.]